MNLEGLRIDRDRKTRARRRRWPGRAIAILVVVALLFLLRGPLVGLWEKITLPEVEAFVVTKTDPAAASAIRGKAANGYVVAARRAALSSDFAGRIAEIGVREGTVVKKGDVVARLDDSEQRAAVDAAKARVDEAREGAKRARADLPAVQTELERLKRQEESAKANLDAATSRRDRARSELTRVKDLFASKVSTESELDDARAALDVADADVRAAEAALAAAKSAVESGEARARVAEVDVEIAEKRSVTATAELGRAEAALEKTVIRAPFDGVVVLKDAEVGEVVSPFSQGGSNARGSVATMVDFASLEVQANVPETSLDAVVVGAPAEIFLDAWPDVPYRGRVDRIWPTADRQKGTIEVRVVFLDPDDRLRPDLGVRVVFLPPDAKPAEAGEAAAPEILVPESAVVSRDGKKVVFLLDGDRVRARSVETGVRNAGRVAIASGLADGDRIVAAPAADLAEGDRVRVKE